MLALPLFWLGAAVIAAVSSLLGLGEVSLALAVAALIQLLSLVRWRRRRARRTVKAAARPGLPAPSATPLVLVAGPARGADRFGGPGPDVMQLILLQKLVAIERRRARLRVSIL